jgi:hypothetical protein
MAYYLFLADRHGTGSGARWAIMGIAVKVAQSVRYTISVSLRLRSRTVVCRLGYVRGNGSENAPLLTPFLFLDRDSGRWKVDPIETQRRRELFWEVGKIIILRVSPSSLLP